MTPLQVYGALIDIEDDLSGKISAGVQFTIDSHRSLPALQEILKSHQAALLTLAATIGFWRNCTLGALGITIAAGLTSLQAQGRTSNSTYIVAYFALLATACFAIMWTNKRSEYAYLQYLEKSYIELIDMKKAAAPAA